MYLILLGVLIATLVMCLLVANQRRDIWRARRHASRRQGFLADHTGRTRLP